jgi:S-methyl-5-thioribulose 1-phosphate isomerase
VSGCVSDAVQAVYRVAVSAADLEARVESLLLEQTVEVPRRALEAIRPAVSMVGRVTGTATDGDSSFRVTLEYPEAAIGSDPAQLLNVVFGNSSLQPDVELLDVSVPETLARSLGGPGHGLAGLRRSTGVEARALTCSTVKPLGISVEQAARLVRDFALGGLDVVKDDHGLADQAFCPFAARVRACIEAVECVAQETGHSTLYVPNITGAPRTLLERARIARELGARAVMVAPMLAGLPFLHELARGELDVPVLAHPALSGAQRIAPLALLGTLFPLYGADGVIFTSFGGRFSYDRETCLRLVEELREPRAAIAPALPVVGGGMTVDRVDDILAAYGVDCMLLVGGSLLEAGEGLVERSRDFVARVRDYPSQP